MFGAGCRMADRPATFNHLAFFASLILSRVAHTMFGEIMWFALALWYAWRSIRAELGR